MKKDNKAIYIAIACGIVLIALAVVIVLVIRNNRKNKSQTTSEKPFVIQLDIPQGEKASEDVAEATSEKTKTSEIQSEESKKEVKTEKTSEKKKVGEEKKSEVASEKKTEEIPLIVIEKEKETQVKPKPDVIPANPEDEGVIELPYVPYEDLME